ncbi:hypothetical protein Fot_20390 [Forsythia ovata]|uniref:Uncharacterized protein n=1 Tax=Forsythia ovata TaxID=205694 RepID=A0ABD1VNS5_9LAMI
MEKFDLQFVSNPELTMPMKPCPNSTWNEIDTVRNRHHRSLLTVSVRCLQFDQPNLVRADVGAEELDGAEFRMSNIDSEMLDVEENAQHDYVDSSDGFTTSAREGENCD